MLVLAIDFFALRVVFYGLSFFIRRIFYMREMRDKKATRAKATRTQNRLPTERFSSGRGVKGAGVGSNNTETASEK